MINTPTEYNIPTIIIWIWQRAELWSLIVGGPESYMILHINIFNEVIYILYVMTSFSKKKDKINQIFYDMGR